MKRQTNWVMCLIYMGGCFAFAQGNEEVTIKTTYVRGNVYMLEGNGGNIGVSVGDDGILIVDDQFAPLADKIRAALRPLNDGALEFVLNTHHHGDHTGGNEVFGREAHIIAHDNVRKRLSAGGDSGDGNGLPVITFDESLTVHFNGEVIQLHHLPAGHTDGDSVVVFTESNVVHMGDQFFNGRFPYVDLGSGGDVEKYLENLERAISHMSEDVKIIPGHGALATLDDLKAFAAGVEETIAIIRKGIADRKNLEELQQEGMPTKYSSWGENFIDTDRWIAIVYESLTR